MLNKLQLRSSIFLPWHNKEHDDSATTTQFEVQASVQHDESSKHTYYMMLVYFYLIHTELTYASGDRIVGAEWKGTFSAAIISVAISTSTVINNTSCLDIATGHRATSALEIKLGIFQKTPSGSTDHATINGVK